MYMYMQIANEYMSDIRQDAGCRKTQMNNYLCNICNTCRVHELVRKNFETLIRQHTKLHKLINQQILQAYIHLYGIA